jgi:formylglycine-generating enzyme
VGFLICLEFSNHASIEGQISKPMKRTITLFFSTVAIAFGQPLVSVETVAVGNAGNSSDTTGFGAVPYEFLIGKYEVTINQYAVFLNTVASTNQSSFITSLWNPAMETNLNIAGVSRSGSGTIADPYSYQVIGGGNRPIAYVSWFDAARFVNWVNNGATASSSTEDGAYTLNGASGGLVLKNPSAQWYLPSQDEWYKAAYYSPSLNGGLGGYYATATMTDGTMGNLVGGTPHQGNFNISGNYSVTQLSGKDPNQNYLTDVGAFTGSASSYQTSDQGGNLYEWNDEVLYDALSNVTRGVRGGAWENDDYTKFEPGGRGSEQPYKEYDSIGFRVAAVPEPSTFALLIAGLATVLIVRFRRKA